MLLDPTSPYRPPNVVDRDALEKALAENGIRLRREFTEAWQWYGDTPLDAMAVKHAVLRDRAWYGHLWPDGSVRSIRDLAHALGYSWEYDFTYDEFSALVHARGVRHDVEFDQSHVDVRHPYDDSWFQTVAHWSVGWQMLILMTAARWLAHPLIADLQAFHIAHHGTLASLEARELPSILS